MADSCIIAHHFWDRPGGGELVMASFAVATERLNCLPVITSLTKFSKREKYRDWFGIDMLKYPSIEGGFNIRSFGLYLRLLVWQPVKKALRKYHPKFVIIDMPTYRPLVGKIPIVEYIHFPLDAAFDKKFRQIGFYYKDDPYTAERYRKFPLNIYAWGFTRLYPLFSRRNPFEDAEVVLTNSQWTAEIVKSLFGEMPLVLNPPLPPNIELLTSPPIYEDREPCIAMLGRYSHEKRYHWVLQKIAPLLTKEVPETSLLIMGDASTPTSANYFQGLVKLIEKSGLRHRVILMKNLIRKEINNILRRCKVFFHATINEHWGIAVAEAMAHGLPVVVHKSGGAWTDLAERGQVGIGYVDENEAVEALSKLLTDRKTWERYAMRSLEKAKDLHFDRFIERAVKLLTDI
ncbi:glycosyltransferase [Pyrobaculum aerophilum]|uniref:Glycosyltransferase (Type 1) n=3 Tax=Pyrobaculum aerophilum TaxID=13773 RepID=Q8ZYZ2_PYRAE|nr:glycosyltransferase [Pyrobaculum aerophilum]AAL62849.1 glycosyltransferase (type 1) [Pyrobaculum aerophilum str. IM2]RFA93497.1 glycosyl transferase [Pyrobaculum aerophilum]